jgi:hypothetical protein
MNRFAYRIHYRNDPRRIGNIPMDGAEVSAALARFRDALPAYMAELDAVAQVCEPLSRHGSGLRIVVSTGLDWAKVSVALAAYADRHGLHATHIASAPFVAQRAPATGTTGAAGIPLACSAQ